MKVNPIHFMVPAFVAGVLVCGVAQAADTPPMLAGATVASAEDVVAAQAAGVPVIDTRVASEYADGHIKGAINVPYREKSEKDVAFDASKDEFNLGRLPKNKAAPVVLYCNGPECWKSFKASAVAIKGGFTKILWFRGGFPNWKSKGLPIE
jgi:rhodanese-related sulfurtransferase